MILEYNGRQPEIDEEAYVAPNATIRGDVTIGRGSSVLYGAILTDEGGPVRIGESCVVMEQAVIRGTPGHPAVIGDAVLIGPGSHLSGCQIDEEVFIATGCSIFNGAHIKKQSEVRINGVVHVNSVLEPGTTVPIGWVAVGDPAQLFSPDRHEEIWERQKQLNFPKTVWGVDRSVPQGERIRTYAGALQRHRNDKAIEG